MQELEGRVEKIEKEITPCQLAKRIRVTGERIIMDKEEEVHKCTCVFDDNGNILEPCKLHADWRKQAEDRVRIQALEGMIEILTNGFGKTMPPDEPGVHAE
jgi:hypothetical protein